MKKRMKLQIALLGTCICLGLAGTPALADDKPTADLSVAATSQYIWRGFELSQDSVVLQPSMTVGYKGFSANVWGNLDTDLYTQSPTTNSWTETDFTLSYDFSLGPVGMTVGYIYYGLDGAQDTQEAFVSASFDTMLSPTVSVYRDYDNLAGWYATLGISHSLPVKGDIALDLGAQVGYLSADDASSYGEIVNGAASTTEEYSALHDGLLSASVTIPVNEYVSITPGINFSFPLSSDASDRIEVSSIDYNGTLGTGDESFVYGGVSVSLAF